MGWFISVGVLGIGMTVGGAGCISVGVHAEWVMGLCVVLLDVGCWSPMRRCQMEAVASSSSGGVAWASVKE